MNEETEIQTAEFQQRWISKKDFGTEGVCYPVIQKVTQRGRDKLLTLSHFYGGDKDLQKQNQFKMSIWGDNWNYLVNTIGTDVPSWIGRIIEIRIEPQQNGTSFKLIKKVLPKGVTP